MRRTILIVDNDLPTLELYQRELGREYRVLTCTDERGATQLLASEHVSAAVIEPFALGENGWARVAALTRTPSDRRVPLLVCSTQDDRRRDLKLGAVACLIKPVLPSTLLDAVRKIARPE
jgi:response regulator RpfG family c-di-GMP phosphodiesterase